MDIALYTTLLMLLITLNKPNCDTGADLLAYMLTEANISSRAQIPLACTNYKWASFCHPSFNVPREKESY